MNLCKLSFSYNRSTLTFFYLVREKKTLLAECVHCFIFLFVTTAAIIPRDPFPHTTLGLGLAIQYVLYTFCELILPMQLSSYVEFFWFYVVCVFPSFQNPMGKWYYTFLGANSVVTGVVLYRPPLSSLQPRKEYSFLLQFKTRSSLKFSSFLR